MMQNSSKEKHLKGMKKSGRGAFIKRVWKSLKTPKTPFLQRDEVDMVEFVSQPESCVSASSLAISKILRTTHRNAICPDVCLPGQFCEELEVVTAPSPFELDSEALTSNGPGAHEKHSEEDAFPGPSKVPFDISEELECRLQNGNPSLSPEAPCFEVPEGNPKKGRKKTTIRSFLWKCQKTVKNLFLIGGRDRAQLVSKESDEVHQPESPDLEPGHFKSLPSTSHFQNSTLDLEDLAFTQGYYRGCDLGRGCYGSVFKGINREDRTQEAAIKCLYRTGKERYLDVDGESRPVLAEVAMMLRLGASCSNIIQLYDWMEVGVGFILIMEFPGQCKTLEQYSVDSGRFKEVTAFHFMRQLRQAVKHCFTHGVFHGDLHFNNILVTAPFLDLKLIDFGCALPINNESLRSSDYHGNDIYCPPEIMLHPTFLAEPAYVWCLGALFNEIIKRSYSLACRNIIRQCLAHNPAHRPKLEQL